MSLPLNRRLLFLLLDGPAPSTFDSKALTLPGRRWEGTPSWIWELDRKRGGRGKRGRREAGAGERSCQPLALAWGRERQVVQRPKAGALPKKPSGGPVPEESVPHALSPACSAPGVCRAAHALFCKQGD